MYILFPHIFNHMASNYSVKLRPLEKAISIKAFVRVLPKITRIQVLFDWWCLFAYSSFVSHFNHFRGWQRSTSNFSSCFDLSDFYSTALLSVDHAKEVSATWTMANNVNASASFQSCFELYTWIEARVWKVRTTTTLGDILWCSLIIKLYNQRTVNVRCLRRLWQECESSRLMMSAITLIANLFE